VMNSDDLRIKQILLNLLGNAAKFTRNGEIRLHVAQFERDDADWLRFCVSDTGIGMSQEQLGRAFERFSQADQTTTRRFGGTGLGLALAKSITEALGGSIAVESAPGKGSTFAIELPARYESFARQDAAPAAEEAGTFEQSDVAAADEHAGDAVLVVEDDPSARDFLTRALSRAGFEVVVAHDGPSGLAKAREIAPIAILLDVMLPGLDGWRVLRELRADPKTARIPVIVETVLDERHFAYALGAAGYLRKPISREDLTAAVGELAARADAGHALVVDDDREAVDLVAQMLERDGWTVSRAHDGAEALTEMERARPSLVLVDLLMPGMDGYAFIRRVRDNNAWDDVALVVLTADDIANSRIRNIASETSGVVQKGAAPLSDLVRDLRKFARSGRRAASSARRASALRQMGG
jgi:CheY-like chemotaxis protein